MLPPLTPSSLQSSRVSLRALPILFAPRAKKPPCSRRLAESRPPLALLSLLFVRGALGQEKDKGERNGEADEGNLCEVDVGVADAAEAKEESSVAVGVFVTSSCW